MRFTLVSSLVVFAIAGAMEASNIGVTVNGTCAAGSCPPATLSIGSKDTQAIDYTLKLADGDTYLIDGSFTATNSSGLLAGHVNHLFQVTYEGNGAGGLSMDDSINVQGEYAFQTTHASEYIYRDVVGAFGSTISASSTGTSCGAGTTEGCVGTLHAPGSFNADSPDFTLTSSGGVFDYDPYFVSNFAAGSAVGSYIVWGQTTPLAPPATAPEPGNFGLLASGLCAVSAGVIRRVRRASL